MEEDAKGRGRVHHVRAAPDELGDRGAEACPLHHRGAPRPGVHDRRTRPALRRVPRGLLRDGRRRAMAPGPPRSPHHAAGESGREEARRGGSALAQEPQHAPLPPYLGGSRSEPQLRLQVGRGGFQHKRVQHRLPGSVGRLRARNAGSPGLHGEAVPRRPRTRRRRCGAKPHLGRRPRHSQSWASRHLALGPRARPGAERQGAPDLRPEARVLQPLQAAPGRRALPGKRHHRGLRLRRSRPRFLYLRTRHDVLPGLQPIRELDSGRQPGVPSLCLQGGADAVPDSGRPRRSRSESEQRRVDDRRRGRNGGHPVSDLRRHPLRERQRLRTDTEHRGGRVLR